MKGDALLSSADVAHEIRRDVLEFINATVPEQYPEFSSDFQTAE